MQQVVSAFTAAVMRWQLHQAKDRYGLHRVRDAHAGAITAVQRFGSALNLNLHLHTLTPDGVFIEDGDRLRFVRIGRPDPQALLDIGWETCLRTLQTGHPRPLTASAARIEVVERDEQGERTRSEWLVAGRRDFEGPRGQWIVFPRPFFSTDGRLVLAMTETRNALMFRSALEVQALDGKPLLRDGKPFRQVVRVNHPLQWGGYAFYQNNFTPASATSPAVSVFRVKYDRGIPLVYTGFVVLTLGVCVMLYFDPFFRRRRQSAPVAAG